MSVPPMENDRFVDAQAMHARHPATFAAPTAEQLRGIVPGAHVKVCVREERFWCAVTAVDGERIDAACANDLVVPSNRARWRCGAPIAFETRHVLDVLTEGDPRRRFPPAGFALNPRWIDLGVPLLRGAPPHEHAMWTAEQIDRMLSRRRARR